MFMLSMVSYLSVVVVFLRICIRMWFFSVVRIVSCIYCKNAESLKHSAKQLFIQLFLAILFGDITATEITQMEII